MPPNNPFLVAIQQLDAEIYLSSASPSFGLQLNILRGLFGLLAVICIASLGLRAYSHSCWHHKFVHTTFGIYFVPNSSISWTVSSLIFYIAVQFYITSLEQYAVVTSNLRNSLLFRSTVFLPIWLGAFMQAWSQLVHLMLNKDPKPKAEGFELAQYPNLVNSLVLIPIVALCTVFPLSKISSDHFNKSFEIYLLLKESLQEAAIGFEKFGSQPPLVALSALKAELSFNVDLTISTWKHLWYLWTVLGGIMLILYTTSAAVHFRSLSSQLEIQERNPSSNRRIIRSLKASYRTLVFTTSAILIGGLLEYILIITLAVDTEELAKGSSYNSIILLATLWIIAALGSVNVVIFFKSFPRSTVSTSTNQAIPTTLIRNVSSSSRELPTIYIHGSEKLDQITYAKEKRRGSWSTAGSGTI